MNEKIDIRKGAFDDINSDQFLKTMIVDEETGLLMKAQQHKYWKKVGTGPMTRYFYKDPKTGKVTEADNIAEGLGDVDKRIESAKKEFKAGSKVRTPGGETPEVLMINKHGMVATGFVGKDGVVSGRSAYHPSKLKVIDGEKKEFPAATEGKDEGKKEYPKTFVPLTQNAITYGVKENPLKVEGGLTHHGHDFVIHRSKDDKKKWMVSHLGTGTTVIPAAEEDKERAFAGARKKIEGLTKEQLDTRVESMKRLADKVKEKTSGKK
jgi:hypothetical protein